MFVLQIIKLKKKKKGECHQLQLNSPFLNNQIKIFVLGGNDTASEVLTEARLLLIEKKKKKKKMSPTILN